MTASQRIRAWQHSHRSAAQPPSASPSASPSNTPAAAWRAPGHLHDMRGGLVTLLGCVYIVVLIPSILGLDAQQAAVASIPLTALACVVGTLLFAWFTKLPFAVGPGIVPASIIATFLASGIPFSVVLGIELIAGALFVVLVATGAVRGWVHRTPPVLKHAGQIAIGLYLLLAALRATGVLHAEGLLGGPPLSAQSWLFLAGLAAVLLLQRHRRVGGYALLIGIALTTAGAAALGLVNWPETALRVPLISFVAPDVPSAFELRYVDEILILLYVVIVDVIATLETIATCSPELREADGKPRHFDRALLMSAVVFMLSPPLGSVPMLVFFESLGGVLSGARSRLAAMVCAAGFCALIFLAPLASVVPAFACAVALGFIGCTITQHAAAALPSGADDVRLAALGRQLASLAVIVMIVSQSVALTLFALFAGYPLAALGAQQKLRSGCVAAALVSVALASMMFV